MATPNVDSFKTLGLPGSGARANLLEISFADDAKVAFPSVKFLAKAGQIPGSTISILPINHGGRVLKIPGLRTFDDWTCTIINDDDSVLRSSLINWMLELSGGFSGSRTDKTPTDEDEFATVQDTPKTDAGKAGDKNKTPSIIEPTILGNVGYKTQDIKITQFNQRGEQTQQYKLVKAWPNAIADIPLDWSTDGIEEFTVTFSYDYWTHTSNAITVETTGNVKVAAASAATSIDVESPTTVTAGIVS